MVHWHGLVVPNEMDGPAYITQPPIEPGETYTYEYTVRQAGTFFYHSHLEPDRQQALGMYGALIVDAPETGSADWTSSTRSNSRSGWSGRATRSQRC